MKASPMVTLSAQIDEQDLLSLADNGVQLIICNRPDGESAEQPSFDAIKKSAEELGMQAVSIAFKSGEMDLHHIKSFTRLLNAGKKTHAYCRTGNRSFCLYAAFHASTGKTKEEIIALSEEFGFDIAQYIRHYYAEVHKPLDGA
tara:strand:+ start:764 stop:1195 length:432 start_codon:yes stop_codon:yes gene_type:complete